MIRAINHCQHANCRKSTDVKQPFLPYDKSDLLNDYILKNPEYIDHFFINFPCHCVLGQVLLDTNLLDDAVLWKEVIQPSKKSRIVGPHKSKQEKTTNKKKTHQKNKKFKSVTLQIPEKPRSVKIQKSEPEQKNKELLVGLGK